MGFKFEKEPQVAQVVVNKEEYDDLCNMRGFIYDNNLVIQYEMYLDVIKQVNELKNGG